MSAPLFRAGDIVSYDVSHTGKRPIYATGPTEKIGGLVVEMSWPVEGVGYRLRAHGPNGSIEAHENFFAMDHATSVDRDLVYAWMMKAAMDEGREYALSIKVGDVWHGCGGPRLEARYQTRGERAMYIHAALDVWEGATIQTCECGYVTRFELRRAGVVAA